MVSSEELRAAMERRRCTSEDVETLRAAVRELYEALESAEGLIQFDRGLSDEPEIVKRYRVALEEACDNETV